MKGNMKKIYAVFSVAILSVACIHVSVTPLGTSPSPDKFPSHQVGMMFASLGDSPDEDCVRIAVFHAKGGRFTDEGDLYDKMLEETGQLGGNTLFITKVEDPTTGERIVEFLGGRDADRNADAFGLFCPDNS